MGGLSCFWREEVGGSTSIPTFHFLDDLLSFSKAELPYL